MVFVSFSFAGRGSRLLGRAWKGNGMKGGFLLPPQTLTGFLKNGLGSFLLGSKCLKGVQDGDFQGWPWVGSFAVLGDRAEEHGTLGSDLRHSGSF